MIYVAVWKKVDKGRAGIRWDSAGEKLWKDTRGNQRDMMSDEKFGRYKTEAEGILEMRERLAPRNNVNLEKHLELYAGLNERIRMKTDLYGPLDFGDLDLPERNIGTPVAGRRRK